MKGDGKYKRGQKFAVLAIFGCGVIAGLVALLHAIDGARVFGLFAWIWIGFYFLERALGEVAYLGGFVVEPGSAPLMHCIEDIVAAISAGVALLLVVFGGT